MAESTALRLGVEQEFELFAAGEKIDFRTIFSSVTATMTTVPFRNRALAAVVGEGYMLACDEGEAEFATAPVAAAGDGCAALVGETVRCREHLLSLLEDEGVDEVRGYSTHVNIGIAADVALAQTVAETLGPALTLLLEGSGSPGLLIRPRPLRLEIASEYVDDDRRLLAALVLLAGAVPALVSSPSRLGDLPRARLVRSERGTLRGGLFLPRDAFGESIHEHGRLARVTLADGDELPASDFLARWSEFALEELEETISASSSAALHDAAAGIEVQASDVGRILRRSAPAIATEGRALGAIADPPAGVSTRFVDWHGAAFGLSDLSPSAVVGVPWDEVPGFLDAVAAGTFVAPPIEASRLADLGQLRRLAVYSELDEARLGSQAFFDFGAASGKKAECPLQVRIERIGDYPAALAAHLTRPYYRRRLLEEQEGADLLVTSAHQENLGLEQRLTLRVDPALALADGLRARIYTTDDRLTYRELAGAPYVTIDPEDASVAYFDLRSDDPMHAIHLIGLRYRQLTSLPGHAVEVSVEPDGMPGCAVRRVNLLLYEHDLGNAAAGNATSAVLNGTDLLTTNVANGNLNLQIPLFNWQGRGIPLRCTLSYNSFHAAQMEAAARMGRLNGLTAEEVDLVYARNTVGSGWSFTYGLHVLPYVLSEGGENVRRRLELVGGDGNHIQFEASDDGTYAPAGRGTLFDGDQFVGASLRIAEWNDGYELTDFHHNRWRFDDEGRLVELASAAAVHSGGALAPIALAYTDEALTVTDTVGRALQCDRAPDGHIVALRDSAAREWTLEPGLAQDRLGTLRWPSGEDGSRFATTFSYGDPFGFLAGLTNRRGFETSVEHELDGDAWGRLQSVARAGVAWRAVWDPVLSSDGVPGELATATITDARGTQRFFVWNRLSLALRSEDAFRPEQEDSFGPLPESWIRLRSYEYFPEPRLGDGKLPAKHTDLYGFVQITSYDPTQDGLGYLVKTESIDGRLLFTFTYDPATNLVHEQTDANGRLTTKTYDPYGNLAHVTFPRLHEQAVSEPAHEEAWVYGADGRLVSFTDRGGYATTYGYDEGGRDPFGTGLPTSRTRSGDSWQLSYRQSGSLTAIVEPFYAGRTDLGYDMLDRLKTVTGAEAEIIVGVDPTTAHAARELWTTIYDENGNVSARQLPLGAGVSLTYDAHDRVLTETNSDGIHQFDEYDGLGTLLRHTDRRGNPWLTRADYLGRPRLIIHPQVQAGQVSELFRYPDDGKGHLVRYLMGPLFPNEAVGYPRRHSTTAYDVHSNVLSERRWTNPLAGVAPYTESAWIYERDVYGHLGALDLFNSSYPLSTKSQSVYREVYELDEWYRVRAVTVSGEARTEYERNALDEITLVRAPPHSSAADQPAEWQFGYDAHGRETTVTDPYGTVVRKSVYTNAGSGTAPKTEHFGIRLDALCPDPLQHRSGDTTLSLIKRETYNARGLVIAEEELDLTVARSHYDERGLLVLLQRGDSSSSYQLDPQGRQRFTTWKDRARTSTVEQRFDQAGNRIFLSGEQFSSTFEYDAADRFISEQRTPTGEASRVFRTVTYDIFGRPVTKALEQGVELKVTYDDKQLPAAKYDVTVRGTVLTSVSAGYHWSGRCRFFSRSERATRSDGTLGDLKEVLHVNTSYDALVRPFQVISYGFESLVRGTVETTYYPAGTRKTLTVTTGGSRADPEQFSQTFDYHPDWQVMSITSAHDVGKYEFRYQPNGTLSSWRTPRATDVILEHDAHGAVSFVECKRPTGTRPYVRSRAETFAPGERDYPKQHTTRFGFYHEAHEFPDNGYSRYASEATYNTLGLLEHLVHKRRGKIGPAQLPGLIDLAGDLDDTAALLSLEHVLDVLGLTRPADPLDRTVTNIYRNDKDRTLGEVSEHYVYPDGPDDSFHVARSYTRAGRLQELTSDVRDLPIESVPIGGSVLNPNELVEGRHRWHQTNRYDGYGRLEYLISRNLVTPVVFNLWGDARRWLHAHQAYSRDELGRSNGYSTITLRSDYDDPNATAPLQIAAVDPENDAMTEFIQSLLPTTPPVLGLLGKFLSKEEKTIQDTGVHQRVVLHHGPTGEIGARTAVTVNIDEKGHAHRFEDKRLYLFDGSRVIAEVNNGGELARYYELGPGTDLRLSVLHKRKMRGNWVRTVDQYLYGAGMSSVALAGRIQLPDDSFVEDKVVRRFDLFDMPLPGDGRRERMTANDQLDELTLGLNSALYVAAAQPTRAALPPGVVNEMSAPVGSYLPTEPTDPAFGMALPHHAFLEDVHDAEPALIDPSELPGMHADTSVVARIERFLDWLMAWNPIWKLNRTKALVKEGRFDEAKELVKQATIQIVEWVLCNPFEGDPAAFRPSALTELMELKSVYDDAQFIRSIPDLLNFVNGFDPKTGEAYSWDDRLLSLIPPPDPFSFMQRSDTHGSPYGLPKVHSGEGCFPAETTVWTVSGPTPIASIKAGDRLPTFVEGRPGVGAVDAVYAHVNETLRIELASETIVASPQQPLLRADDRFVEAGELRVGDRLLDADGEEHAVLAIQADARQAVHNLTVSGDHVYLVGASRLVAHNKGNLQRDTFIRRNLGWARGQKDKDYWGIAFYLIANGLHEQVWQLPVVHRGQVAEAMLAIESYRHQKHVGAEEGGFFPTYDFMQDGVWTSVKSVDPIGGRRIGSRKPWHVEAWTPEQFAHAVDHHLSTLIRKGNAGDVLHIVVPGGVLGEERRNWMRAMGAVRQRAAKNNVSLIFRSTMGGWAAPRRRG